MRDVGSIFISNLVAYGHDIGAIDRKAGCNLTNGPSYLGTRVVTLIAIGFAYLNKHAGQSIDIAAQALLSNANFSDMCDRGEVSKLPGKIAFKKCMIDLTQFFHAFGRY